MSENEVNVEMIRAEVAPVVQEARALVVVTAEDYAGAANFLKVVKGAQKKVVDHFAAMKAATHAAWKAVTTKEAETLKPLTEAEGMVKNVMLKYQAQEEAKRREEQRKLQAAADEAARKERERLEKAAAKLKTPEKRESLLEQAAAVVAPVIEVAREAPKVSGQSIRKTWKARVTDIQQVPREWLIVNESALNAFAKSTKGAVKVPGVEFFEESTLASSSM
jgi:hypothetical protein